MASHPPPTDGPGHPALTPPANTLTRAPWRGVFACRSEVAFALYVSLAWLLVHNVAFWQQTVATMWHGSLRTALFFASLFVVVLYLQSLLLLLAPSRGLLRAFASVAFLVAAAGSYFASHYGVVMNREMLRNVFATDLAEAGSLLTPGFLAYMVLLGVLPALVAWRVALPARPWRQRLWSRARYAAAGAVVTAIALVVCSADYAVFFREHKPIRFTLSPFAPITSTVDLAWKAYASTSAGPLQAVGGAPQHTGVSQRRPLVLFVVVGETARAANFELGGYARATNPELEKMDDLVYFPHTSSCGTATATSLPCMFSHLGRAKFDVDEAGHYANLLDALRVAGVEVEWRDNNSGCKGVCARVEQVSYGDRRDPVLCPNAYCYDEVMLTDLSERLRAVRRDTVIVFHQIGSHGPAYSERYPPAYERFKPACRSNELQTCSREEILNAYDNTIAYTDHVLARMIGTLRDAADQVDGLLIYTSDHGESLGERGLYLHGMPYSVAPDAQTDVPLMLWTSAGFAARAGLRPGCLTGRANETMTHDNLYHTVLGAAGLSNQVYDAGLDVLAPCRNTGPHLAGVPPDLGS